MVFRKKENKVMYTHNKLITTLIGLSMLALALSGCASGAQAVRSEVTPTMEKDPTTTPEAVSHGNEIGGYVELVDALRAAGATVEPAEEVEQAFFSVLGQKIMVNGVDIQVFEYADEAARKADSDQISADGTNIGTSMITWVDQPNFWINGRIIVLYVGKDGATIDLLSGVLGEPITKPV
jgi:hypothetical protein